MKGNHLLIAAYRECDQIKKKWLKKFPFIKI